MKPQPTSRKVTHAEPAILFALGAVTFAIAAKEVDEIRDVAGLLPPGVTSPSPKVKFRLVREGKTYWVLDASEHFHMVSSRSSRVLVLRNASTAVLVERIDRMAAISAVLPLPPAFQGEERSWYRGLTIIEENAISRAVPVVNADTFRRSVAHAEAPISR